MLVIFFKAIIMLYNLKNAGLMAMVLTAGIKQKTKQKWESRKDP